MNRLVTIEEAAKTLKLSTKTVRRYLQSGKLSGHKIEGRWTISLPMDTTPTTDSANTNTDEQLQHYKTLCASLQQDRDWLRQQVDRLTFTNANLVAALQHFQYELGPTTTDDESPNPPQNGNPRPWWKFWAA